MKQSFQHQLTENQVQAQKVYQNHQELEQSKVDNEAQMEQVKKQNDEIVQSRNDMELRVQAVDHEREEIQREFQSMSELKGLEQQKHKAQLDKQSGIAESELEENSKQTEDFRAQLAELDEQLMREE